MRRELDKQGRVVRIEYTLDELAPLLDLAPEQVLAAPLLFPTGRDSAEGHYLLASREDLDRLRKRAAVLRTGMSEKAVRTVEEAGYLGAYAALAQDCPRGLTAHVWRSYALVALLQNRFGIKIGPSELAERANLRDVEMAEKHLRLLVAGRFLRDRGATWEHQGVPIAFR